MEIRLQSFIFTSDFSNPKMYRVSIGFIKLYSLYYSTYIIFLQTSYL